MNDERLRQRLREGDPATGENGLRPGEIHAMRRAVLAAAPEPRRRLLPVLALAGAAAAAILIALFALRPDPVQPPAPPRIAAVPAQPSAPRALQQPSPTRTEPPVAGEKKKRPIQRRRHLRAAPEETATLAALDPAGNPPEEPGIRQIQFSAPGGTRIIWTLTSGKASR
jgi:hypothetical protein